MPDTEHANPPAFPNPGYYPDDPQERLDPRERMEYSSRPERGLSLRDYFAAAALPAAVALITSAAVSRASVTIAGKCNTDVGETDMATAAYAMADAMLKAREGR